VRGTGASGGRYSKLWSPEEQTDSVEILDWVVQQPWSNGKVSLWGLSYDGNVAAFTATSGHKAVQAAVPMFLFWDLYRGLIFPGGIMLRWFAVAWQGVNNVLDRQELSMMGWFIPFFTKGVTPVFDQEGRMEAHITAHQENWNANDDINEIRYRNESGPNSGCTACEARPYTYAHTYQ